MHPLDAEACQDQNKILQVLCILMIVLKPKEDWPNLIRKIIWCESIYNNWIKSLLQSEELIQFRQMLEKVKQHPSSMWLGREGNVQMHEYVKDMIFELYPVKEEEVLKKGKPKELLRGSSSRHPDVSGLKEHQRYRARRYQFPRVSSRKGMFKRSPRRFHCNKCGTKHSGLCRAVNVRCYRCCQMGHYARLCPQQANNFRQPSQESAAEPRTFEQPQQAADAQPRVYFIFPKETEEASDQKSDPQDEDREGKRKKEE